MVCFWKQFHYYSFREGDEEVKHPDHVEDVAKAYKWTCDNIHKYHGDGNTIILMGHSAGAHLVTLLALDQSYISDINASSKSVKGVIGMSGVYNLGRLNKFPFANAFYITPMTKTQSKNELYQISPLTHVRKTDFPFLFLNAKIDSHLPKDAQEMTEALARLGVDVIHKVGVSTHHGSIISCIDSQKDQVTPILYEWIMNVLKK